MLFKTIVVCCATGNQGYAVADALLKRGNWAVTALTRDPGSAPARLLAAKGAILLRADVLNLSSLLEAFASAYGVFGITQPWLYETGRFDMDMQIRQGRNIIWAAKEAGVKHLVFITVINLNRRASGVPWIDSKLVLEWVLQSHIPDAVILKPALYMENLGTHLLKIVGDKVTGRFGEEAKVPYIALADIGKTVATVFEEPALFRGKVWNLAGDLVKGVELAEIMNSLSGDGPFRYKDVNKLFLRLFRPRIFEVREFFELQGRFLESSEELKDDKFLFLADSVKMKYHIAANLSKLIGSRF